ncbi:MAG: DUF3301 domain-containing protein [Betaproteobacteria bacterium]|nr:DUF3301 domain-containing protein [Betaproteobacteria bacterium]
MPWFEFFALLFFAALAWLWYDSLRAREAGVSEARASCAAEGWQFLDETVAIESLRLARDDMGQLRLRRVYRFEFSDTGNNRRAGNVVLFGDEPALLHLERPLPENSLPPRPTCKNPPETPPDRTRRYGV